MFIIIMGVAGAGKTTIGSILAEQLGWTFYDADHFHSTENREKMSRGIPLTDQDRTSWLTTLQELIRDNLQAKTSSVLACSALKASHRDMLKVDERVKFVYLKGTYLQIESRLTKRTGHYMPVELLASQFEALEEPQDALVVDITLGPQEIVQMIRKGITL